MNARSQHTPGTAVICVENTHNRSGGRVIPLDTMRAYREIADRAGVGVHLDGARVFNAATALGVDVREVTHYADTVSFCLSKGLRAPVGSLLCGTRSMIDGARYWRKRLGGGMRQSGLLAACGIVSLTTMVDRLADDHRRARTLAERIAGGKGLLVDPTDVQTNMVVATTERPASAWVEALGQHGVMSLTMGRHLLRLVLHADVDDEGVERAAESFAAVAAGW